LLKGIVAIKESMAEFKESMAQIRESIAETDRTTERQAETVDRLVTVVDRQTQKFAFSLNAGNQRITWLSSQREIIWFTKDFSSGQAQMATIKSFLSKTFLP
jgi:hypothetical protein